MLAGFLVVFFVEPPQQFFKDRTHGVVVQSGLFDGVIAIHHWSWAQIDLGGKEFFDQRSEHISFGEPRDLIMKFEFFENILHICRITIQVRFKICLQLRLARAVA